MCNFITAVLPVRADNNAFRTLVDKHHLLFAPLSNPHLLAQLEPGEGYFHATRATCDCVTGLVGSVKSRDREGAVRKLRQKGWSDAKVARWLQATAKVPDESRAKQAELSHGAWAAFIGEALLLSSVPYLGLLQHSYKRSTHDEAFALKGRVQHSLEEFQRRSFVWQAKVVYVFKGGAPLSVHDE